MMSQRPLRDAWDIGSCLCLIPARGGSTGVPDKNLRLLGGVPLIVHSIESASASAVFDCVHVSTEDPRIAKLAAEHGAIPIDRPASLARDDTPMAPVVEHALEWYERERDSRPAYIFLLQPTSPLRSADDIRRAAMLVREDGCDSVMGVFEADDPPQWGLTASRVGLLAPVAGWDRYLARRQDLPPTYFDGSLYAIETDAFLSAKRFLTDRTRFFVMPRARAVDIDTEFDLMLAEFLLQRAGE
jgi:CMP-N-acetylneuraminic acid synthetase